MQKISNILLICILFLIICILYLTYLLLKKNNRNKNNNIEYFDNSNLYSKDNSSIISLIDINNKGYDSSIFYNYSTVNKSNNCVHKCPTNVKNSKCECCNRDNPSIIPLVDINDRCCSSGIVDNKNICCPSGRLDNDGNCCLSRIITPSGQCCDSNSHIVKPVIGYTDECCPSGIKTTRDGMCCPENSIGLDEYGNCKIGLDEIYS
jgi:hypothetical protein